MIIQLNVENNVPSTVVTGGETIAGVHNLINLTRFLNGNILINNAGELYNLSGEDLLNELEINSQDWVKLSNTMNVFAGTKLFQREVTLQLRRTGKPVATNRQDGVKEVALSYLVYFLLNLKYPEEEGEDIVRKKALEFYGLTGMPYMGLDDFANLVRRRDLSKEQIYQYIHGHEFQQVSGMAV